MEPPVLDYVPQLYRYQYPLWQRLLLPTLSLCVGVPILFGLFGSVPLLFGVLAGAAIIGTIGHVAWDLGGGVWECRIEAGILLFRRPGDRGWVAVPIREISTVFAVSFSVGDRWPEYELLMSDGRRERMDHRLIRQYSDFKRALRAANPSLAFERRDGDVCHACGDALRRDRRARCPACDTPIPAPPAPVGRDSA